MKMEKDYTLLRPFDLEKAKTGEAILWGKSDCIFLGESVNKPNRPELGKQYRLEHSSGLAYAPERDLVMAPLSWVEGKPVYKGDMLYSTFVNRIVEVTELHADPKYIMFKDRCASANCELTDLTWTPPKKTREVKLLCYLDYSHLIWYADSITPVATWIRVPSEDRTVTVEE